MAEDQDPQLPLTPPTPPGGDGSPGALHIQPVNIEDEMRKSYLDYSMSVIIGRALPDIRDGLKPVHRRILYTMQQMGLQPNRATRKCARIVGDVMGKYHPHGNLAVYDALVRLAQTWSLRYPLIFGQGNFGSVDGDPPAADRYTEAKLAPVSTALLEDLDKETVDFRPNYDGSEVEPDVLPARIPNLLINGSDGIAVGMATKIPPHNLTEIIDATITLVNDPNAQLAEILKFVQGPDFPTAGIIHGRAGIFEAYRTGRGRFMMRAKAAIENVTKDRQAIIVTEIPYQVNKAVLVKRIAQLVNDKEIEDISDVRDESDRDGMRIVVELKRGTEPQIVLNQLYKHTSMQEGFSMILLAVVNGQPREMGLITAIKHFINHRVEVVRRRTAYPAAESERPRAHSRRLSQRPRSSRQRHHHHPRQRQPRRRPRKFSRLLRRQENRYQHHRPRSQARSRKALHRAPGRSHPRTATASPHQTFHRRNFQRAERSSRAHRRLRSHPRLREKTAQRHHQRTRRSEKPLRR